MLIFKSDGEQELVFLLMACKHGENAVLIEEGSGENVKSSVEESESVQTILGVDLP